MTQAKHAVLTAIRRFWREHKYAPDIRELGSMCDMSPSNVLRYVKQLDAEGLIRYTARTARSIVLVAPTEQDRLANVRRARQMMGRGSPVPYHLIEELCQQLEQTICAP